jgi:hypothetical protein
MTDWLCRGGALGVVLQRPGAGAVSASPFTNLQRLGPAISLRDAGAFENLARAAGLERQWERVAELPGGKRFAVARSRLKTPVQKG